MVSAECKYIPVWLQLAVAVEMKTVGSFMNTVVWMVGSPSRCVFPFTRCSHPSTVLYCRTSATAIPVIPIIREPCLQYAYYMLYTVLDLEAMPYTLAADCNRLVVGLWNECGSVHNVAVSAIITDETWLYLYPARLGRRVLGRVQPTQLRPRHEELALSCKGTRRFTFARSLNPTRQRRVPGS